MLEDFREFDRARSDLEDGGGSYDQALLKEHASISRSTGQVPERILFVFCYLRNSIFLLDIWMPLNRPMDTTYKI